MKAIEIQTYLRSLNGGWVDQQNTVDRFITGDPQTEVTGIAVGWMSYTWALQQALRLGCNLFITHEPTFYDHFDRDLPEIPWAAEKRRFVEENRIVIIRCHDLWDQFPQTGIPDAWAAWLGLGEAVAGEGYYRVYDVTGRTAGELAKQVALRTRDLGLEAVQLIGRGEKPVSRLVIGTGAITPLMHWLNTYRVDAALCTDDGIAYWREGALALDIDLPLIVVHHHTAEEPGLIQLARHLREYYPHLPVYHISQSCMYRLIRA